MRAMPTARFRLPGQLVTPGLVDLHAHGFAGISHGEWISIGTASPAASRLPSTRGRPAPIFRGLPPVRHRAVPNRILAFLYISRVGLIGQPGELVDTRMIDVPSALRVAKAHADVIVGIKVRCSENYSGPNDLDAVRAARTVADQIGKPVMIHVGSPHSPMEQILELAPGPAIS